MLTDADCRNATCPPTAKRRRLTDAHGLYLEVAPNGSKRWFWKFYPEGKESRLALGSYPSVSLKAARSARDDARRLRQTGANPVQQRKLDATALTVRGAVTFEGVARALYATKRSVWSESHATQWLRCLEKDVFPALGSLPLADVSAPALLVALRKVQQRGAIRMAHDLREFAGQVFRYGIATGQCERNPAADLRGALVPFVERNLAAVLEPAEVGALLRAVDGYSGQPLTRIATLLSAMLFQRPGNIRELEWSWVDLDGATIAIPSANMKGGVAQKLNGRPHVVPLSTQAVELLREAHTLSAGGRYVFPSLLDKDRPMSENTVRGALRRLGYSNEEATAHGFRAMARTLAVERLGVPAEVVEAQLAHAKSGPLGAAYDRAEFVDQRRALMQRWSDYLEMLRENGGAQC